MKLQYLGDSKDSFKWDYHDYLMRALGHPVLNLVLMMTERDDTKQGRSSPERYPSRPEVLELCRELRSCRDPALLCTLPERTSAKYSVEMHREGRVFPGGSRCEYFKSLSDKLDQVVFVDPDNGLEPERSRYSKKHVLYCEINSVAEQISSESAVSVFQHPHRGQRRGEFERRFQSIRDRTHGFATALYWDVRVMFVQLSRSEEKIRLIRKINTEYCKRIESQRPDIGTKLRVCK